MVKKQLSLLSIILVVGIALLISGCSVSETPQIVESDQSAQDNSSESDEIEESFEEDFVEENSSEDEVEIGQLY